MGLEYTGKLSKRISEQDKNYFLGLLSNSTFFDVIEINRISYILKGKFTKEKYKTFNEDFELKINEDIIYLVFYSGTKEQRVNVTNRITEILQSNSIEVKLEEE